MPNKANNGKRPRYNICIEAECQAWNFDNCHASKDSPFYENHCLLKQIRTKNMKGANISDSYKDLMFCLRSNYSIVKVYLSKEEFFKIKDLRDLKVEYFTNFAPKRKEGEDKWLLDLIDQRINILLKNK